MEQEIRVLELYSGIGGMHFALAASCPDAKVVAAVDINDIVNRVYSHNFPNVKVMDKGIEGFSVEDLNKMHFNMVLMSPPCQPFTRIGRQRDVNDPRTKSFLHFLSIVPKLEKQPQFILLENVKGFETSVAHDELCKTLDECGYQREEILISPKHLGIPNSRLRYFMLAKKGNFHSRVKNGNKKIWTELPIEEKELQELNRKCSIKSDDGPDIKKPRTDVEDGVKNPEDVGVQPLRHFLEDDVAEHFRVTDKTKDRYINVLDIVTRDSTNSTCFTKSYTQYAEGTGSVLNLENSPESTSEPLERNPDDYELRYFTPREVSSLMCFPKHFSFPENITRKQRYRMLGNSLNVKVVSYLISLLLLKE